MAIYKTVDNIEYKLVIEQEQDWVESPREWCNLWTLVTAHRRYSWDEELPSDAWDIDEAFDIHLKSKWLTIDDVYYHKVWLYEHSWVRISTAPFGCRWDSGQWGYIYISTETIRKEELIVAPWKTMEQTVLEILANEILALDQWYSWDIYWFVIESREFIEKDWKKFYSEDWDCVDACGWFYWKDWILEMSDHMEKFSKEEIKNYIDNEL